MVLVLIKKITLFSKIKAVRALEVKLVSWASQLSLQALIWTWCALGGYSAQAIKECIEYELKSADNP